MNIFKPILLFGLLLSINISTCFADNISEEQTFEDINSLKIDVSEGSVIVKKHSLNFIKVNLVKSNKQCRIDVEKQGETLKIKNDKKSDGCNSIHEIYISSINDIEVSLGANKLIFHDIKANINFNVGAGEIEIDNVEGNVNGEIGAGKIKYRPVKSNKVTTLNLAAGTATLDCYFPPETSIKSDLINSFMNKVNSSVKLVNDGTQNFIVSGAVGVGSIINMSYTK